MLKSRNKNQTAWRFICILLAVTALLSCFMLSTANAADTTSQSDNTITSAKDIPGKKVGVQLGTTGDEYVTTYEGDEKGTTIERYNKAADAIQSLKQQKIDCVVIDEQTAKSFTEKNSDIKILDEEFAKEQYALCIKKGNKELLDKLNNAIDELQADGTLSDIVTNYTGSAKEIGTKPYNEKNVDRKNGTLVVATNAQFKPYEYYEDGKIVGIDMDMMRAICDKLGMELKIEDIEFDSIITSVQSGKADVGAAGMSVTEDRKKNVDFSNFYAETRQVIVVRNTESGAAGISFFEKLQQNFVDSSRWSYIVTGLGNTLLITLFAIIIGIVLGALIAIVRTIHDQNHKLKILNFICKLYLTIIRGTPAMIQLLIIYYVIFASVNIDKVLVAVVAFGLNSAAYVAEVIRSGINSVDKGQFEAGRSLGLTYKQTMLSIILPQAFKNILPALCNECISLLKETAISGYIGLTDLTKAGDIIRSQTFEAFIPLIAVALIYLVIVMILTVGVNKLERKLKNDNAR